MFLFLKELLVVGVSIFSALLIFLGFTPESAVAPDLPPPAVIEKTPFETDTPSERGPSSEDSEEAAEPSIAAERTPEPKVDEISPLITDYETSLQNALDALAQIKETEEHTPLAPKTLNETVRSAVVNILCTTASSGPLSPISGSGVIIDPRGIILTNAHVAQYFLLKDYPYKGFIECTIRTGSPAIPTYTADLLFLPPTWIAQNAQKIDDEAPIGNGEHDYALVQITGTIDKNVSPASAFPHLPLATTAPKDGDAMLLAAYPAGFLGGTTIQKELYATSANVHVRKLYTFELTTVDLFDIGGSVVSQQGSSGGAAAREDGALSGIIVTSSDAPDTASRELRALSTEYIIRDFAKERGTPLQEYLQGNLAQEYVLFWSNTAPALAAQLINVLEP